MDAAGTSRQVLSRPALLVFFKSPFTLPADLAAGTHALTLEIGGQTSNVVMIRGGCGGRCTDRRRHR